MTPLQFKAARLALGLNQRQMAEALRVAGEATIRSWESGRRPIPGPVMVAIELMLKRWPPCGEWQPIEGAPHDTGILVGYFGDDRMVRGTMKVCYIAAERVPEPFVAGWPFTVGPTHWMPLPSPPA